MPARTRLTTGVREKLVEASKLGMTRDLQCAFAGIGKSTLFRWMAEGRKAKKGKKRELWEALKEAEALGAKSALDSIRAAHEGERKDWKAAAWYLERRHGYRKNGPAESAREEVLELVHGENRVERIQRRIGDGEAAIREALRSNSFQAYFAGIRLVEGLNQDLEIAELQGEEDDGLDDMSSPRFLRGFESAAEEWPDQLLEAAIGVYERRHNVRMLGVG